MMVKSVALITLLLQTDNISCFTQNGRVMTRPFNYGTVRQGYLDNLAPAAPQGSGPKSYFPTIATNPKPSTVSSYLDTVSGAAPAPAAEEAAPVVSSGPSSATSNAFEYSNTFTYTDEATQQTHVHTHHHLHSYNYNYENDAVTIEDAQKVDVEVTVTKAGDPSAPATPVAVVSAPAASYAPAKTFAEPSGQASSAVTGGYLAVLGSNVMSSTGGNAMGNPHLAAIPVTGTPCSGGMALGNSYLGAIPVTATPCSGYNALQNFASIMDLSTPKPSTEYPTAPVEAAPAAPSTPAPSAGGDYLASMGSGGGSSPPKSYAPGGGGVPKAASGNTLGSGSSYLGQF